jgi:hypothetical protein
VTEKYFGLSGDGVVVGARLALRATLAWELIGHFGIVAGEPDGEDSAGRAKLATLDPRGLVARAFAIADAFVELAEARGEVAVWDKDAAVAACQMTGDLERIRSVRCFAKTT